MESIEKHIPTIYSGHERVRKKTIPWLVHEKNRYSLLTIPLRVSRVVVNGHHNRSRNICLLVRMVELVIGNPMPLEPGQGLWAGGRTPRRDDDNAVATLENLERELGSREGGEVGNTPDMEIVKNLLNEVPVE